MRTLSSPGSMGDFLKEPDLGTTWFSDKVALGNMWFRDKVTLGTQ